MEFALIAPLLLLLVLGLIDFSRAIWAYTTVADAARQGVRQAVARASSADTPFGSPIGTYNGSPCSGTAFTTQATGTGCLSNQGIFATVKSVLAPLVPASQVVLVGTVDAPTCRSSYAPPSGGATLCIMPGESGTSGTPAGCSSPLPSPGALGTRYEAWNSSPRYKGCYLVQVTVIYGYQPWTTVISNLIGTINLSASSTLVAEF